jgi:hypothetical protein
MVFLGKSNHNAQPPNMTSSYHSPDSLQKTLSTFATTLLIIIPILYGAFRIYPLLTGPVAKITSPHDGEYVSSTTFEVIGYAKRASTLYLQGKPITVNEAGQFTETLVTQAPYTILILVATDKYGASATTTMRVIPR